MMSNLTTTTTAATSTITTVAPYQIHNYLQCVLTWYILHLCLNWCIQKCGRDDSRAKEEIATVYIVCSPEGDSEVEWLVIVQYHYKVFQYVEWTKVAGVTILLGVIITLPAPQTKSSSQLDNGAAVGWWVDTYKGRQRVIFPTYVCEHHDVL